MNVDWRGMLVPDTPLLEIIVRGSLVYLGAFLLLRVILKREAGTLSVTDLIVVVFLADAAQNAMSANYHSVPDGLVLMAVIVLWAVGLDILAYRSPWFERLLKPPPLPLIKDGRMLRQNMRREFVTAEELLGQLRLQGIDDVSEVKQAYMESDGRISVIERDGHRHAQPEAPQT